LLDPQLAAHRLNEIASLLEVRGENPFKSRAFTQAARVVGELEEEDIAPLVRSKEIAKLPGIGTGTLAVLSDLAETGDSEYLESLRETTPKGLVEMLRIPGLGPTRIHRIHEGLKVETVQDLEAAARDGRLARLSGFGIKTADKILKGIASLREKSGQLMHGVAASEAGRLQRAVMKLPGVSQVEIAGSLRRSAEVVRDIDLVVVADSDAATLAVSAKKIPGAEEATTTAGTVTVRFINGVRADLHCVHEGTFPLAQWRATGSAEHCDEVIKRLRSRGFDVRDDLLIDKEGAVVPDADEHVLYRSAGLAWIPLELRENRGEIDAAAEDRLPRLIELGDLRGILHCHSRYSDGSTSIEAMAKAAQERGWTYIGISDHSQAASYAGGMVRDAVLRQHDEIDALNAKLTGFRVLKGLESDILANGSLDYDSELLDRFDYVIGSIHSRFSMDRAQMTERILRAMDDPHLTIIGHPTGRQLLRREPFAVDLDAIMDRAAEAGIAIELNTDPNRLDLDWRFLRAAVERGVTIEIGPDAHSPDELGFVEFGVQIARKGWLEAGAVLNTRNAEEVLAFASARRGGNSSGGKRRGA
jgi:DNA polymerase (family 10)